MRANSMSKSIGILAMLILCSISVNAGYVYEHNGILINQSGWVDYSLVIDNNISSGSTGGTLYANFSLPSNLYTQNKSSYLEFSANGYSENQCPSTLSNYTITSSCLYNGTIPYPSFIMYFNYYSTGTWGCRHWTLSCIKQTDNTTITIDSMTQCWPYIDPNTQKSGICYYGIWVSYNYTANLTLNLSGYKAACNETHGLPVVLRMNNSPVGNPYDPGSSPGLYNFNCSTIGNISYTANYTTGSFTIFPIVYNVTVALNGSDQNLTGTYPYPIDFTCEGNGSAISLYLNASSIINDTVHDLAVGYWNFSCNNSADQKSLFLTINKASSITRLYLNGSESDTMMNWPQSSNVSANSNFGVTGLYMNGSVMPNPDLNTFSPGTYVYVANTSGNENHTGSTVTYTLSISKAFGIITLLLNGHSADLSLLVGELSNASASVDAGSVNLYRDGILKSNPDVGVLGRGFYVYYANSSGDANHSPSSTLYTLDVHLSDNANDEFIGAFAALGIGLIIALHYFRVKLKK